MPQSGNVSEFDILRHLWLQMSLETEDSALEEQMMNISYNYEMDFLDFVNSLNQTFISSGRDLYKPSNMLAIVLATVSILANVSTLISIGKVRKIFSANLRLIFSLSISDILTSIHALLLATTHITPYGDNGGCLYLILRSMRMMSHIISLLNLLGLALDHYMAIVRTMHYPTMMTCKRVNIMIGVFWLFSFLGGFSDFFIPGIQYSYCEGLQGSYCEIVSCTYYDSEYLVFALTIIIVIIFCCLYSRIFIKLHKYQTFERQFRSHVRRNIKGLVTTCLILGTFMCCWLPYCIFQIYITIGILNNQLQMLEYFKVYTNVDFYLYDLVLLNSLIDSIIYAVRMCEIRNGYRSAFNCFSSKRNEKRDFQLKVKFPLKQGGIMESRLSTTDACSRSMKRTLSLTTNQELSCDREYRKVAKVAKSTL